MVYGGLASEEGDGPGLILNDLWVFDLTSLGLPETCPWMQLSDEANPAGGRYGGALVFEDHKKGSDFYLIGGYQRDGATESTAPSILRLPLRRAASFEATGASIGLSATFADLPDPVCEDRSA